MRILVHQCCGPCSAYPLTALLGDGHEPTAYFYNPNIHPCEEYYKRLKGAIAVNEKLNAAYDFVEDYGLREFLDYNSVSGSGRCLKCYEKRLLKTAEKAVSEGFDSFTSTLLYSRRQNHEAIKAAAEKAAENTGANFYYRDFRIGWEEGVRLSKEWEIYRQNYCGCVYSEEERFRSQLSAKFNKKPDQPYGKASKTQSDTE